VLARIDLALVELPEFGGPLLGGSHWRTRHETTGFVTWRGPCPRRGARHRGGVAVVFVNRVEQVTVWRRLRNPRGPGPATLPVDRVLDLATRRRRRGVRLTVAVGENFGEV